MRATRLKTNRLYTPLGLGDTKPRFSWNAEDGITQTVYRLIARCEGNVIWDTGRVYSAKMTDIRYCGLPLRSRQRVDWSLTLWDENNIAGETADGWFEMGLLDASDWSARWISGDYKPNKKKRYPVDCFRKTFTLKGGIRSARLYASARGVYDVMINGHRIEDFVLAPGMTDYRKRIQYQTYDVTALLRDENAVELRLADGWFRGSVAAYGVTNGIKSYNAPRIMSLGDERFIGSISRNTLIGYKYFSFDGNELLTISTRGSFQGVAEVLTEMGGTPVTKIYVEPTEAWHDFSTQLHLPQGIYPVYFRFKGKGKAELIKITFGKL